MNDDYGMLTTVGANVSFEMQYSHLTQSKVFVFLNPQSNGSIEMILSHGTMDDTKTNTWTPFSPIAKVPTNDGLTTTTLSSTPSSMPPPMLMSIPRHGSEHHRQMVSHQHPHQLSRQQPHHQHVSHRGEKKQSRSRSLKGALNLPKETQMLRNRLDRVVECFQQSVVEHDNSQRTKLQQLQLEKVLLKARVRELEIENLKYVSELEDEDEKVAELETQNQNLHEEVDFLSGNLEHHKTVAEAFIKDLECEKNEVRAENESMMKELNKMMDMMNQKDDRILQLQRELDSRQLDFEKENVEASARASQKQNTSTSIPPFEQKKETNGKSKNRRSTSASTKTASRRSFHTMTPRGTHCQSHEKKLM